MKIPFNSYCAIGFLIGYFIVPQFINSTGNIPKMLLIIGGILLAIIWGIFIGILFQLIEK